MVPPLVGRDYTSWHELKTAVLEEYEDVGDIIASFNRLRQTGGVADYIKTFRSLLFSMVECTGYTSDTYYVHCFIGGLKDEFKYRLRQFRSSTLAEAYRIAKLEELRIEAIWKNYAEPISRTEESYQDHN